MSENNQTACSGPDLGDCDDFNSSACYHADVYKDCCQTCTRFKIRSFVTDCQFGDKVEMCLSAKCNMSTPDARADCCATCSTVTPLPSSPGRNTTELWSSSSPSSGTTELWTSSSPGSGTTELWTSSSSGLPTWTIPVSASAGVLLVILTIVVLFVCVRRRGNRGLDHLSPIDERMYNDYKMSKRPPIALPRHLSKDMSKMVELERRDSAEYAYINPEHVIITNMETNTRRSGSVLLPQPPPEYLEMSNSDKYGYVEFENKTKKDDTKEVDITRFS